MKIGPSTWPMNTVAAVARAGGPRRPMVFSNTTPNNWVTQTRIFQCHSSAANAQTTRITGSTRKAKTNNAPPSVRG